jgi:site-specific DNA-methyltransferase (adenine-specific)
MNPPYTMEQAKWVKKAIDEVNVGNAETVVVLIPARTETVAWQKHIFAEAKAICFVNGRLKFSGCSNAALFTSAIVLFGRYLTKDEKAKLSKYGKVIGKAV